MPCKELLLPRCLWRLRLSLAQLPPRHSTLLLEAFNVLGWAGASPAAGSALGMAQERQFLLEQEALPGMGSNSSNKALFAKPPVGNAKEGHTAFGVKNAETSLTPPFQSST